MIPLYRLSLEQERDDYCENSEGNHLLNHLELHQVERPPIALEAYPVGRYREAILKKSNAPGKQDDENERPACGDFHLLKFQMAVPRERHEYVREDEHDDGPESLHNKFVIGAQSY